jgi:folate-binding protein YgfZ
MTKPYSAETLLIEGPDAVAFAHAQFSSNIRTLATNQWQFSAWLDPQGRVKALFHLARLNENQLLLLLRGGSAAEMVDALRRFVFRSKLTLTALPPRGLSMGAALPLSSVHHDEDFFSLGCGTHSLAISSDSISDDTWRLAQLREGWPWLPRSMLNELLAPSLALQRLHAAVIDKGCYPGQEIVARLHYRGGNKKHLHRIKISSSDSAHPKNAGDILRIDAHEKVWLLDVVSGDTETEALAVVHDDVVAHAADEKIFSTDDGTSIRLYETWNA